MNSLSERLSFLVHGSGRTQRAIADATGISAASLTYYITGQREPSASALYKLACEFKVDMQWLLTGQNSRSETLGLAIQEPSAEYGNQNNATHQRKRAEAAEAKLETLKGALKALIEKY